MSKQKPKWEINCYEANKDGSLTIYIEASDHKTVPQPDKYGCMSIVIPSWDVDRLIYGAIDALKKEESRR